MSFLNFLKNGPRSTPQGIQSDFENSRRFLNSTFWVQIALVSIPKAFEATLRNLKEIEMR